MIKGIANRLEELERRFSLSGDVVPDPLSTSLFEFGQTLKNLTTEEREDMAEELGITPDDLRDMERQFWRRGWKR
mgnify:CR=1 FL=1